MNKVFKLAFGDFLMNATYMFAKKSLSGSIVWKLCFSLYKSLLSIGGMKPLPIITKTDYLKRSDGTRIIVKQNREGVSVSSSDPFEESPVCQMKLNDLCITNFNNVLITSGSDSIVDGTRSFIINDFCVDKSENVFCSDSLLCRERGNWGLLRKVINNEPKIIESGIMICGKYPNNYYHCLFENLNRSLLIDDNIIPVNAPLLVDKVILSIASLQKALSFLVQGTARDIVPIEPGKLYKCRSLYYIDHLNYIIPHHRKLSNLPNERSYYDSELLKMQRVVLLTHKSGTVTPPRVFLTRANAASRLYNEEEVFNVIKDWGFEKVAPEKLSFEEQMALFNNAEFIIGGSGAAFSNVVFCHEGCKILCFRPVQSKDGTPLFKTIAYINGALFWHYRADKIESSSVHSNYYISPSRLKVVLTELLGVS